MRAPSYRAATHYADRGEIAPFVYALARHARQGTYFRLHAQREDNGRDAYTPPFAVSADRLAEVVDMASDYATWAANERSPINFCPPLVNFDSKRRIGIDAMVGILSLSVEVDGNANALTSILGPPTIIVRTGSLTSDGQPRLDAHWRLVRPTFWPSEHLELRNARLLAAMIAGTDPQTIRVLPMLRWPGSWNRSGTAPRLARIVEAHDTEIDLQDARERLLAAWNGRLQ